MKKRVLLVILFFTLGIFAFSINAKDNEKEVEVKFEIERGENWNQEMKIGFVKKMIMFRFS